MSVSINIKGYSTKNNAEFIKHKSAVEFCITNELSYPIETVSFFKGKLDGDDLENIRREYVLDYLKEGVGVKLKIDEDFHRQEFRIKTEDIPKEVDLIIVKME